MDNKNSPLGYDASDKSLSVPPSHTPGPWHFVPENAGLMVDHGYGILYGEPDSWGWEKNLFVSVGCSGNVERALGKGAAEANARLIAAAPDLLQTLKDLLHELDTDDIGGMVEGQMERARKVIAKAEGAESDGAKGAAPARELKSAGL